MIEEILPANVVAVDTREDWPDIALYPDEEATLNRAVDRRRREFVTVRGCARRALKRLGLAPISIPTGRDGEPCWPAGIVGSMTHCSGYRACALARAEDVAGIGIDAEPNEPLPDGVLSVIAGPEERVSLIELTHAEPAVEWDRLLFSAKEAVYKAWFPLTKHCLGFNDVIVTFDPQLQVFNARLTVPRDFMDQGPLMALHGRWMVCDGLVLNAVALSPSTP